MSIYILNLLHYVQFCEKILAILAELMPRICAASLDI